MIAAHRRNLMVVSAAIVLLTVLPACSVGPFDIALRSSGQSDDSVVPLTVTAVLATNTQIAAFRTATAESHPLPLSQDNSLATPPAATTAASALRLVYGPDNLILYVTGTRPVDLSGFRFTSATSELSIQQWDNGFLTAPLNAFPAGDCLMAWSVNHENVPKPLDCNTRHAWIAVSGQQLFWLDTPSFTVSRAGQALANCPGESSECIISLDEPAG